MGGGASKKQASKQVLEQFDTNNDGNLDRSEQQQLVNSMVTKAARIERQQSS